MSTQSTSTKITSTTNNENLEIERRFIIHEMDKTVLKRGRCVVINQGYVGKDTRVRLAYDVTTDTTKCTVTAKTGIGLVRTERTAEISEDAASLLLSSAKYSLRKLRYVMSDGWEIDVFKGPLEGLTIAEKEFSSEEEAMSSGLPSYLKKTTEVTTTVTNRGLAKLAAYINDFNDSKSVDTFLEQNPPEQVTLSKGRREVSYFTQSPQDRNHRCTLCR